MNTPSEIGPVAGGTLNSILIRFGITLSTLMLREKVRSPTFTRASQLPVGASAAVPVVKAYMPSTFVVVTVRETSWPRGSRISSITG